MAHLEESGKTAQSQKHSTIRIYTLGTFHIEWEQQPLPQERLTGRGAAPALGLLKALVTKPDRFAVRDWLMEQFWPDSASSKADERLDDVASGLRTLLRPPGSTAKILHFVYGSNGKGSGYRLENYPFMWVDADAFEWYVEQAARLDRFGHDSLSLWEHAYQLASRGIFLPEERYSDWAIARREQLEGHYRQCVHRLVYLLREMGAYEEALLRLRTYWQQYQTDEDVLRVLLEMLGERERYQEAEQYYGQAQEMLEHEGREPDPHTQDMVEYIRARQIQRNHPVPSVKESGQRLWSHVPLHTIYSVRPELHTSFAPSTNELQKEVSLFVQSLRYAIIEAVQKSGETLMHSMSAMTEKDDMDRKKRDLLKLLGTSMVFAEFETSYQPFIAILVAGDQLRLVQHEMMMRWNVYHRGNTIQAHHGLNLWLEELEQCTKNMPENKQGMTLLSTSYQLHGSLFRDEMNYSDAHKAYQRAYLAADECGNTELKSASLARRGVTFIQQKQPIDAIQYLEYALTQIGNNGFFSLRGYIHQALSEAHAMVQHQEESQRHIDLAEQALMQKDGMTEMSNCSSNTTSVTSQKGVNAVLLKEYRQALTLLDIGLVTYDSVLQRGRARLIAQKAEAFYGLGSIDESTKAAMEALTIAQTIGSQKTMNRVKDLHSILEQSRYRKEVGIVQLGTMLTML